ncbi:MAG: hypothetical protein HQ538_05560 [Parcubacteria group bacterium]|nr:hypothetical protein [Parcubacteria group bacterium]
MITESKNELFKMLSQEIDRVEGLVTIQAGHFALIEEDKKLVPAVLEDINNKGKKEAIKSHPYMGNFPLKTWQLGVSLAQYAISKSKKVRLVILVNDWQWVPKVGFGEKNRIRNEFYKSPQLPVSFEKELNENGLNSDIILPLKNKDGKINNKYFFSEQKLRNQFKNHYSAACDLENQCAREYIPLILQLQEEKTKLVISFIPKTCMNPINIGSRKSKKDYDVDFKIINIFANGIYRYNFFENINVSII